LFKCQDKNNPVRIIAGIKIYDGGMDVLGLCFVMYNGDVYIMGINMRRTQIYFDEPLFAAIRHNAARLNLSISAYIRDVLQKEIKAQKENLEPVDFSGFAGMWEDYAISQESLRQKAWK
jgi:hypothetical protein